MTRTITVILMLFLLGGCAGPTRPSASEPGGTDRPAKSKGARLYGEYCVNCHRPLAHSVKAGRSVSRIHWAIRHIQPMHFLKILSIEEIHSIAEALAVQNPAR